MNPAAILAGAGFTALTAFALGLLAAQWLNLRVARPELPGFAFLLGSALLSTLVFLLAAVQLAHPWCFALTGAAAVVICIWRRAWRMTPDIELPPIPALWKWILRLGLLAYGSFTFVHAMAPEMSADGTSYHLGLVARYLRQGGFQHYTTNMYANMPEGIEMLFLFAFAFGKHSAAALVHWQFLLLMPFLLLNCGRRFGWTSAGAAAALLYFMTPIAGVDGASAYIDIATSAVVFGTVYLLLIWEAQGQKGLAMAAAALAGFAYACKMTAFPAVPFALAFLAWKLWREHRPVPGPVVTAGLIASAFILPWLIKNTIIVGNPFSPFLNRWFPTPYVRVKFEDEYRAQHRDYYGQVKSPAQAALEVTVRGGILNGALGPVFLLSPLALLALRWPLGRRALLAALVFALPYPSNIGTRFLLTPLPFLCLAFSMALTNWRGMATAVVLFHAFFSWPDVLKQYTDPAAWRLDRFRLKQALRIESEDGYLMRMLDQYAMAKLVETLVPPDGRVLTYGGMAESYITRDILVAYQAGFNNMIGEILATGIDPAYQPHWRLDFSFAPRELRQIRLVQTRSVSDIWSITELRVFSPEGQEIDRQQSWRLTAWPSPWDIPYAFDNCPVTRWRSWQPARPGDYVLADFGVAVRAGSVKLDMSPDQPAVSMRLEGQTPEGDWQSLGGTPTLSKVDIPDDLRREAVHDLKRLGITHIVIGNHDFIAVDLFNRRDEWGVTLLGEAGGSRLYKLD